MKYFRSPLFKILDLYILRKFLVTFFFTVLLLVAVLIIIDLAEKADDFTHEDLTYWKILRDYYIHFIPHYANMLSPLMIFISAVFVTAKLATHTEIVAMLSAGISLRRIMVPYFMGSLIVAANVYFLINYVVPVSNKIRHDFEDVYVRNSIPGGNFQNVHIKIAPEVFVYLKRYDIQSKSGVSFTIEHIQDQKLVSKLESPVIKWDTAVNKWNVSNYRMFEFKGDTQVIASGTQFDTTLNIHPDDFVTKHLYNERLTLPELNDHIAKLKLRGADDLEVYLVEKYERMAYPFAIIILSIIGVIVSARKSREGTGFQIAFGFVLAFVYILLIVISRSFAHKGGIPPQYSAWIPNAIFCVIGLYMFRQVPK